MNTPIGIFDSGVGGLTVAREFLKMLPSERIIYFGDTARVPYGSKSGSTIIRYTRQIVRFLLTKDVKAIVVACNTANSYALPDILSEFDIPIVGVIDSGAKMALEASTTNRIGIIGTEATINSGIYKQLIIEKNSEAKVYEKACPLFVPLVEEGWIDDHVTKEVARRYLDYFKDKEIDTLILGCTHYPLIQDTIHTIMGDGVKLINPAVETANQLKQIIALNGLGNQQKAIEVPYEFYVSDRAEKFEKFAERILNFPMLPVQHVDIESY